MGAEGGLSRLRGKGTFRLRGQGLEIGKEHVSDTSAAHEQANVVGRLVVNRDSGEEWQVQEIKDGAGGRKIVQLSSMTERKTFNKSEEDLMRDLKTPGAPWRFKE